MTARFGGAIPAAADLPADRAWPGPGAKSVSEHCLAGMAWLHPPEASA